ncbi:general stress protein [Rhodopila globiformis]|nr:general stress protein [Rhodopila globiformis]
MAQRTVARMYDNYDQARAVVNELETAGVPQSDISLVANDRAQSAGSTTAGTAAGAGPVTDHRAPATEASTGAGAVLGTAVGGGLGLLAGIGALAIPGVGPVVAAGWLVATLTGAGIGAAGGGLLGALTGAGLSRDEANVYAEGVRGGGSLVTVRANDAMAGQIEDIMARHSPVDWQQRRAAYGPEWTGFDETSHSRVRRYRNADPSTGTGPDVPAPGTGGSSYAPGTDPGRRL